MTNTETDTQTQKDRDERPGSDGEDLVPKELASLYRQLNSEAGLLSTNEVGFMDTAEQGARFSSFL